MDKNYDIFSKDLKRLGKTLKEREGDNYKGYWSVAEHLTEKIVLKNRKTEYPYFDFLRYYSLLPDILSLISANMAQQGIPKINIKERLEEIETEVIRPTKRNILHLWLSDKFLVAIWNLENKENKSVKNIHLLDMLKDLAKNYPKKTDVNIRAVKRELNIL